MGTAQKLMTADEFMLLPDPEDGGKLELVQGRVTAMSPVGGRHGVVQRRIGARLGDFADTHRLGEVSVEVFYRLSRDPDSGRAPDVSFLRAADVPAGGMPAGYIDTPPTLAVEVLSPSDRSGEVDRKIVEYLHAGAQRVWIVDPENRLITVYRPGGEARVFEAGETLTSDDAAFALDGFTLPLDTLFA